MTTAVLAAPRGWSYVAKSGVHVTSTVKPSEKGSVWYYVVWYYYARARQILTGRTPT